MTFIKKFNYNVMHDTPQLKGKERIRNEKNPSK